jgi:archaellum component FlaC
LGNAASSLIELLQEHLQKHSLQAKLDAHPEFKQLEALSADLAKVENRLDGVRQQMKKLHGMDKLSARAHQALDNMKAAANKLERQMSIIKAKISTLKAKMIKDIFLEADVVSLH